MDSIQQYDLQKIANVKVKVSKTGKWLTHIFPDQKLMVSFPINYYRAIIKKTELEVGQSLPEALNSKEGEIEKIDNEEVFCKYINHLHVTTANLNTWLADTNYDCQKFVLCQLPDEDIKFIEEKFGNTEGQRVVSEVVREAVKKFRNNSAGN